MPDKLHNLINSPFLAYSWVLLLSAWGGVAGYIGKIKRGNVRFSFAELIGEVCISGFVGIVTYLLCQSAQIDELLTAAMVAIAGHMGSRAILMLEKLLQNKVQKWLGMTD